MEFVAATNNAHKLKEMRRILERMGHTVLSQKEAGVCLDPEENGTTFAENACIKAKAICAACGKPTVADDSGLCVDVLNGAPGVYSARYCGRHGDDDANNRKLMREMETVEPARRGAKFVSAICIWMPDQRHAVFEGECRGTIGFEELGENGFGYDPLFVPSEVGIPGTLDTQPNVQGRTYAQLSADEKDAISHRGRALCLLEKKLPEFLGDTSILGMTVGPTHHAEPER